MALTSLCVKEEGEEGEGEVRIYNSLGFQIHITIVAKNIYGKGLDLCI